MSSDRARARPSPSPSDRTASRDRRRARPASGPAVGPLPPVLQRAAVVGRPGDRWEREADQAAERISHGQPAPSFTPVSPGALRAQLSTDTGTDEQHEQEDERQEQEEQLPAVQAAGAPGPSVVAVPPPGGGAPLPPLTRAAVEPGLGADLSAVRVHHDVAANHAADAMGARAFTAGQDIWLGSGQSPDDVGLMAHEATHVFQQGGGASIVQPAREPAIVQRAEGDGDVAAPVKRVATWPAGDAIDTASAPKHVTLATLRVPESKRDKTEKERPERVEVGLDRKTKQSREWRSQLRAKTAEQADAFLRGLDPPASPDSKGRYYLANEAAPSQPIIVTDTELGALALRPSWDAAGTPTRFHVDHIVEHQLGGADDKSNYWLLEEEANMSSGSLISQELAAGIDAVFTKARAEGVADVPASAAAARGGAWVYSVAAISTDLLPVAGREHSAWSYDDVATGVPVSEHLRPMKPEEMEQAGGSAAQLALFLGPQGGQRATIPWEPIAKGGERALSGWFHLGNDNEPGPTKHNNFQLSRIVFDPAAGGHVEGTLFRQGPIRQTNPTIKVEVHERIPWAGFFDKKRFLNEARSMLTLEGLSPIVLDDLDLVPEKGLVGRGRLLPTVPVIAKAEIDVVIDGSDVYLSKVFTAEELDLPAPIEVSACSLELRFGTEGFQILGEAQFAITGLGVGRIHADAGIGGDAVDFALAGEFDFLSDLFDPARLEVWYREEEFGARGTLGIAPGTVTGLRSAEVTAEWSEGVLSANGTFATEVPGAESGTLDFRYADGTVELGGTLNLGGDVPGIDGGTVEARLVRGDDGSWKVFGRITATPSIPGVSSQITGTYDDGALDVEAAAAYARGMAAGSLTFGFTNRSLDDQGRPNGDPGTELAAYGSGWVTLALAPWLQATAGIRVLGNGEIEVSGEIGLPVALEVFPRKSLERQLFALNLDIPILGVAAAGQRVGIFATVGGGADLLAHFGPATLRDLRLGVAWNPDRQDETTVTGAAALHLPAGAGIRLNVNAGIGAGIPMVSAVVGLEIGGQLGIEAVIGAAIDLDWTPARGLVLEAVAEAAAEPVFRFDITGFAKVELDLVLETITLYEKRWNLVALQFGSGLRLGMRLPVRYEEGQPFEPSLDDVELEVPEIKPDEILTGLIGQLV